MVDILKLKMELFELVLQKNNLKVLLKAREDLKNDVQIADSQIVGYESDDTPISEQMLEDSIKESLEQIKNGEVVSLVEAQREAEKW